MKIKLERVGKDKLLVPSHYVKETQVKGKIYLPDFKELTLLVGKALLGSPKEHVHAHGEGGGGAVLVTPIPCEAAFETSPTWVEIPLAAMPDGIGGYMEFMGVGVTFHTVVIDGTDAVTGDVEWVDDSDSDNVTDLKTAYDFETATARVYNEVWRGRQQLDPGDTAHLELTVTTPDTAGAGACLYALTKLKGLMAW